MLSRRGNRTCLLEYVFVNDELVTKGYKSYKRDTHFVGSIGDKRGKDTISSHCSTTASTRACSFFWLTLMSYVSLSLKLLTFSNGQYM